MSGVGGRVDPSRKGAWPHAARPGLLMLCTRIGQLAAEGHTRRERLHGTYQGDENAFPRVNVRGGILSQPGNLPYSPCLN